MPSGPSDDFAADVGAALALEPERARAFLAALARAVRDAVSAGREANLEELGAFRAGLPVGPPGRRPPPEPSAERFDRAALIEATARALSGTDERRVAASLEGLFVALRRSLARGEVVTLPGLGTFAVVARPPRVERSEHGQRVVEPGGAEVRFRGEAPVWREGAECPLLFEPDAGMNRQVAEAAGSVVLAIPGQDEFAELLHFYLKEAGWGARRVGTTAEARSVVGSGGALMVVLDAGMEGAQALCRELKLRRRSSMIPLIVTYPHVEMLLQPGELIVMGDENIAEPYEVRALLDILEAEAARAAADRLALHQVVRAQMPTTDGCMEMLIDLFTQCVAVSGLAEEQQVALSSAFKEAARNAADHGNKNRSEKKIEVHYRLDTEKVVVTVRDYGLGFDHRQYVVRGKDGSAVVVARERHKQGRLGGLGIMLMVRCSDRLEYNDVGNRVTLTRYLPGRKPGGSA
jgi:anti-sigma regulatory factor (Ser/Thr protein kinase)/nucleoid DNA-binding protein